MSQVIRGARVELAVVRASHPLNVAVAAAPCALWRCVAGGASSSLKFEEVGSSIGSNRQWLLKRYPERYST